MLSTDVTSSLYNCGRRRLAIVTVIRDFLSAVRWMSSATFVKKS